MTHQAPRSILAVVILIASFVAGSPLSLRAWQACDIVELLPGYPEFQGYVAGIWYGPEYVCRDYLTTTYPSFSIEATDQANQAAAERLGIEGTKADWTWENWIIISDAQGYLPICWSCAFLGTIPLRHPGGSDVDTSDPRFASGMYGDRYFITNEFAPDSVFRTFTDFEYRVAASIGWGDPYINAPQLISIYPGLVQQIEEGTGGIDPDPMWDRALEWGGHFPVPGSLPPEDQIFFLKLAMENIMGTNSAYELAMIDRASQAGREWRSAILFGETTLPFKEFFQDWLNQ